MAILLPLTFPMGPTSAIIMLAGIYYGASTGGPQRPSLSNSGEIGSIVTCLDGYQMARKGRAGPALGCPAMGPLSGERSALWVDGAHSALGKLAAGFGPPELFSFYHPCLMMVSSFGGGSLMKSLIMATLGTVCVHHRQGKHERVQPFYAGELSRFQTG